jgi:hypothetical protein
LVESDEQLEWEQRTGRNAGYAALAAAILLVVGGVLSIRGAERHAFDTFLNVDKDPSISYLPNFVTALGWLCVTYALYYLARATAARREQMAGPMKILAVAAPIATAIATALLAFALVDVAHHLADLSPRPSGNKARDDAVTDAQTNSDLYRIAGILTIVSRFALGFALVLVSLNAMRAGLVSRFIGILGIIGGVLSVLVSGAGVIVAFWLAALGVLFLDRWPGGRGPAWDEVAEIPWPSALEQQAQMRMEQQAYDGRAEHEDDGDDEPGEPAHDPHPVSKKRKKKRRR